MADNELHLLRDRVDALQAQVTQLASRSPRRGRTLAVAAFAVLLVWTGSALSDNNALHVFAANAPAKASEVNHNFNQLKSWLEQKVGGTGTANVTVTGTAAFTGPTSVSGVDNDGANAALRVTSGGQTMLLDGNEIDSNTTLYLNGNSTQPVVIGGDVTLARGNQTFAAANSALRVLSISGNAWRYNAITVNEARMHPYWNSYNGAESNTGTLELGYLVANNFLHFAMLGGRSGANLRVEIRRASNSAILATVYMNATLNSFEYKRINTSAYRNVKIKIRAIDQQTTGGYAWFALGDFFVE